VKDEQKKEIQHANDRQSELLESIGRLAGGIAHDFNNLLTSILGYSELLDGQLQLRGNMRAERGDLKEIRQAAERARELTHRLLAFARRLPVSPRILDVNQIIVGMERLLKRITNDNVELTLALSADTGHVVADPTQLEQLLLNLAVNAQDAMPSGGRLTLSSRWHNVERDGLPAGTVIGVMRAMPGECIELAVSDTGRGMSPEFVRHAFEPYVSTKPSGQQTGLGLGLSSVFGLVTQANGLVIVDSVVGQGTTVRVLLPRVAVTDDDDVMELPTGKTRGSETIILAEDDADVRALNARTLREAGYNVHLAEDGEAAVTLASRPGMQFDLVITDVVMPKRNGWEVADTIRAQRPDARVLLVSGYSPSTLSPPRLPERGYPFLSKPFTPSTLLARVRQLLDTSPKVSVK
jgi:nitrogen-specific signal transduction histidine kinase/CheY-like chemotaxis protein